MNEIIKAMEERRSIRKFKPDMPAKADLQQIIEAGSVSYTHLMEMLVFRMSKQFPSEIKKTCNAKEDICLLYTSLHRCLKIRHNSHHFFTQQKA